MFRNGNHAVHILDIVDTLQLNLCPWSFSSRLRRKRNSTKKIHQWVVVIVADIITGV